MVTEPMLSQQTHHMGPLLDAMGKILITWGDAVAVEAPSYFGALQAFNPYGQQRCRGDGRVFPGWIYLAKAERGDVHMGCHRTPGEAMQEFV